MRKLYANFRWGMDGEPQSMLVEDGYVVWRDLGSGSAEDAEVIDLGQQYLLPSYIDAHCHILPTGLDLQKLHLGSANSHRDVLDLVADRHRRLPAGEWLLAVHYDQTKYEGGRHLTRHDIDSVVPDRPVLLRHSNGHASVANSAALREAKVDESIEDPKGGTYVRAEDGRLNGVLLERSHEHVSAAVKNPTLEQMVDAIMAAGDKMADLGISCASDMMTGRFNLLDELEAYRLAAERGCRIRTRLYVQWATVFGPRGIGAPALREWEHKLFADRCKIAGIKIFADGAIGSATAAIYGRYSGSTVLEGATDGQLIYSPERLKEMVATAHTEGYRIAIHSIGDYATDLVMDAYEQLGDASMHRIEHAMLLSDAQIERMARLKIHCTMQPEFLLRFGHAYRHQLGEERAANLKRMRSVIDAGIPLSFNSDRPIVAGDPRDGIRTAVHRPEGFNPAEAVTAAEAIQAYTAMAAVANFDDNMGSLLKGQLADFQVMPDNPIHMT